MLYYLSVYLLLAVGMIVLLMVLSLIAKSIEPRYKHLSLNELLFFGVLWPMTVLLLLYSSLDSLYHHITKERP